MKSELVKLLLKKRTLNEAEPDIDIIERDLKRLPAKASMKLTIAHCIQEYKNSGNLSLWEDERFSDLAKVVTDLLCGRERLERMITPDASASEVQELLFQEVDRHIPDLSFTMKIAVCQCLMKQYSKDNSERLTLYAERRENITKEAAIK